MAPTRILRVSLLLACAFAPGHPSLARSLELRVLENATAYDAESAWNSSATRRRLLLPTSPPIVSRLIKQMHYCHAYSPAHPSIQTCYLDAPRLCTRVPRDMQHYAFVFVITELTESYIETIVQAVTRLRTRTHASIVVAAPKDEKVVPASVLAKLKHRVSANDPNVVVSLHSWPVAPEESGIQADEKLQPWFARFVDAQKNCCGWREYFKLIAWKMSAYKRVILLDLDVHVLQNIDHLFACAPGVDAMYAGGPNGPWQGGFFVVNPSRSVYNDMLRRLHSAQYSHENFWFNSKAQLPEHFRRAAKKCYGCEGPQGFLYWFFVLRANKLQVRELDSCVYDSINAMQGCFNFWKAAGKGYGLKVIHKYATVHNDMAKCRAQAAIVAAHVHQIVGSKDARTLFRVVQCKLGEKHLALPGKHGTEAAGVPVEALCKSYGLC